MRLRTRLFVALATLVVVSGAAALWWVEGELAGRVDRLVRRDLEREARLLADRIADLPLSDSLADALGAGSGSRVTLMDAGGWVVGDSDVPWARLPSVENHADRPEVRSALRGRPGSDRRASETVARELTYAAVPHPRGVVRLARSAVAADALVVRARRLVMAGGAVALALAFLVSSVLARAIVRPLEEVRAGVEALAAGDPSRRATSPRGGQMGALARSIHELAERMAERARALGAERDDLEALFDSLEDGLAVVDAEGVVVHANRAFGRWAGRERPEGHRAATLFRSPELAEAIRQGVEGRSETREVAIGDRTVLLGVRSHRSGALLSLRDLTHLRRLEGVRRDFVANVSHELKTPLTSIVGFAEAVAEDELPPAHRRRFIERILANARRMRALVDDLLDLSRIESGRWEPAPERVDLADAARAVWAGLEPGPSQRRLELRLEPASSHGVHADPDAVRHVLRNLFENALRYAPPDSAVGLRAELLGEIVRAEVTDEGPGIPSVHLPRIFERFYRVDPARSRDAGGTGLGLSIVKHLVTAHGGEVGAESELGRGARVWFTLPAAGSPSPPPAGSPSRPPAGSPSRPAAGSPTRPPAG